MADDNKEENKQDDNMDNNARKCYEGIEFAKVEDKFDAVIQYDSKSETLSLNFTNQTTKSIFKQDFDKESIHKVTEKYHLEPHLLVQMIMDTFASNERMAENLRIFILPNIKQATAKYDEIRSMKVIPDAINIPTGFRPKLNDNHNENNQLENCLLFVLHFSAPPFIYLNYCFLLKEKDVSDYDKLGLRFNDLVKENVTLKNEVSVLRNTNQTQQEQINQLIASVNELSNTVQIQQRQITQLTQKSQQLESKMDEQKVEEINLNLQNNWVRYSNTFNVAKAFKIGKVVYLQGMVKNGSNRVIATLPEGWRPTAQKIFSQIAASAGCRVDVYANGTIRQDTGDQGSWTSLEGICFVTE